MKLYIYKMHAGQCGTDEVFLHVGAEPADKETLWEIAVDHAHSYGVEETEDGELEEDGEETGTPEIWLQTTVTTLKELEEESDYLLRGNTKLEDLVSELEKDGMVWVS